jgi:hypothetical protein
MKIVCCFNKEGLTRSICVRILFIVTCVFTVLVAGAQVPNAFKYQAVARNNAGAVIPNQNVSFRMSVIQGTLPGTVVYTETHTVTTNEFGLATLEIGRGTPVSGNFNTIDWSVTPGFLKTELDPSGGTAYADMGTTELLSVPYTIQAGSAPDKDWIVSGINLYPAVNGNVGVGVASPTQKLHVNGNLRLTGALYDFNNQPGTSGQVLSSTGTKVGWIDLPAGISGSGVNNKLTYWTGSASLGYNDNLHWDNTNGRLGIGTASPTQPLHVSGNMRLTGALYDVNNQPGTSGQVLSSMGTKIDWIDLPAGLTGTGLADKITYWTGSGTLGYNSNLHWDNANSRLGLGTTSPATSFHLFNGPGGGGGAYGADYDLIIEDNDQAFLEFNGGYYDGIAFNDENNAFYAGILYNLTTNAIHFRNGAMDNRLVITGAGNIGIGLGEPTQRLHVSGNMRLSGALYDSGNQAGSSGQVLSSTGSGTDWVNRPSGSGAAGKTAFWADAGTLSYNDNYHWDNANNRLGIGTATPAAALHIFNGPGGGGSYNDNYDLIIEDDDLAYLGFHGGDFDAVTFNDEGNAFYAGILYSLTFGSMYFKTGNNDTRLMISEGGNVGINVTLPTQRLHVNGSMRLTDALYDENNEAGSSGQVLSSTATGVDWITPPAGVTGSGAANRIAFWTDAGTLGSNGNFHWNNANARLGIGTGTPLTSFHLFNGTGAGGGVPGSNVDAVIEDDDYAYLEFNGGTYAGVTFNDDNQSIRAGVIFNYLSDMLTFKIGGYDDRMVITEDGKVGIGTYTPAYRLTVEEYGELAAAQITNYTNSSGGSSLYAQNFADNGTSFVTAVYGKAAGINQPNSFGIAGHNHHNGAGIGAWSYSGDIYRGYDGDWPGGTLRMYLNNAGSMYVDGTYNTFKGVASKGPNEHVALIGTQSPEALVEDCGSATLIGGQAVVTIDPVFVEIANTGNQYQVFLTPVSEDIVILVVNKQSAASFMVKGATLDGKPAECKFHYRIVARDNEYKGGRFEEVDIPEPIVVPREE